MDGLIAELRYSLQLTRRPFKGFWDLKHENYGSLRTALVILGAAVVVFVASDLLSDPLFSGVLGSQYYDVLLTILPLFLLYINWCIASWCLTCLFDGQGTFKDICIATAYALVPLVIFTAINIPLSWFFVEQERTFYNLINFIGYFWSGLLLFCGTLVIHQYSFTKTIAICFFTILGMTLIIYLIVLFVVLIMQIFGVAELFIAELSFRIF